ncbi:unnamed protein product [Brassica rapa]|uniref:Cystatin domain-containing protein n=2 Tax=Brassica TaxID=3705 RepID=A0A3P6BJX2_BRACM|nr:unnamed protein product [Brassica napus]CAG7904154.1 unnamed protein product [Brassica rapa]VDD01670.1 unnamed protein product [Brassica rapa]
MHWTPRSLRSPSLRSRSITRSRRRILYEKVVRGTWDWTSLRHSGIKYNLIISAKDEVDGMSKTYEAIVMRYSKFTAWNELKSFKAVVVLSIRPTMKQGVKQLKRIQPSRL